MKILAIGDIFGRPGRNAIARHLPDLIKEEKADFVLVNVENSSGGKGLTRKNFDEISNCGIDVMSGGNHLFEQKEIREFINDHPIVRPLNEEGDLPGRGYVVATAKNGKKVGVISLHGQVYIEERGVKIINPFKCMDKYLYQIKGESDLVIIDFHAEATSEKRALAWYLDGKVAAIVGTHTHVQTSDEEILPNGTAYITDLGMTGPHASVIGLDKDVAIHRFLTGEKKGFKVATEDVRIEGVVIDVDESTGLAKAIRRIRLIS